MVVTEKAIDQNRMQVSIIYCRVDIERIRERERACGFCLVLHTPRRSSSRAIVTSSNLEADSSKANVTSEKSRGGLLTSQCDTSDVLGGARERLGVGAREEVLVNRGLYAV